MPRTDSEVEQWALKELSACGKIGSREICVFARDGVITLRGSAQSYQEKLAIEAATRRASGVVDVINEMTVAPVTALNESVPASVALTVSPRRRTLVQPTPIERPVVEAARA